MIMGVRIDMYKKVIQIYDCQKGYVWCSPIGRGTVCNGFESNAMERIHYGYVVNEVCRYAKNSAEVVNGILIEGDKCEGCKKKCVTCKGGIDVLNRVQYRVKIISLDRDISEGMNCDE